MEGFNILEQCKKLRRIQSSPYTCPIAECGKVYIGFCGLQYHLVHVEHSIAELKAYFDKLPDVPPTTTPARHHSEYRYYIPKSEIPNSTPPSCTYFVSLRQIVRENSRGSQSQLPFLCKMQNQLTRIPLKNLRCK